MRALVGCKFGGTPEINYAKLTGIRCVITRSVIVTLAPVPPPIGTEFPNRTIISC